MSEERNGMRMTISRRSDDVICVSVSDEGSCAQFLELEFDPADFAMMVTGLGAVRAKKCTTRNLDVVGKRRIVEKRQIEVPEHVSKLFDRTAIERWLKEAAQEPGWFVDNYFGSQGSFTYANGKRFANYRVYRYEDS